MELSAEEFNRMFENQRSADLEMARFANNFLDQELVRRKASAAASIPNDAPQISVRSVQSELPKREPPQPLTASVSYPLRFYVWREGTLCETDIQCDYEPAEKTD